MHLTQLYPYYTLTQLPIYFYYSFFWQLQASFTDIVKMLLTTTISGHQKHFKYMPGWVSAILLFAVRMVV